MKLAAFNATCPFEIGDKIKSRRRVKPGEAETFRLDPAAVVEEVHTITDIVCVHSVKNGTVTFLYELDNSGKLVHIAATPRPEQREAATQSGGVMLIAGDESGPLPPELAFKFPAAVRTITDVVCQHSTQTGETVFLYELDGRGPLVRLEAPPRKKRK